MLMAQDFSAGPSSPWLIIVTSGMGLAFILVMILVKFWFKDQKGRRVHEEQMLAIERGLLPPEWSGEATRASIRRTWLWLAIGLPVFITFAGGIGTALLVDSAMRSGNNFSGTMIAIWLAGGAVALAAVIFGGLGLMADQRQHMHRPIRMEPPQVRPVPSIPFEDRDPSAEKFRKQERS